MYIYIYAYMYIHMQNVKGSFLVVLAPLGFTESSLPRMVLGLTGCDVKDVQPRLAFSGTFPTNDASLQSINFAMRPAK